MKFLSQEQKKHSTQGIINLYEIIAKDARQGPCDKDYRCWLPIV